MSQASGAAANAAASKFQQFINHPAGPKYVPVAALLDPTDAMSCSC
jgi:hypothetical protein